MITKRKIIISVLFLLSLSSLIYLYYASKKPGDALSSPNPSPEPLRVESVFPLPGNQTVTFPNTAITVRLNKPVSSTTVRAEISPKIPLTLSVLPDQLTLSVRPEKSWQFNQPYRLKIIGPLGVVLFEGDYIFNQPTGNEVYPQGGI